MKTKMINGMIGYYVGTEVEEDTNCKYENYFIPNYTKGWDLTEEQDNYLWDNVTGYAKMDYGTVYSLVVSSDYKTEEFEDDVE